MEPDQINRKKKKINSSKSAPHKSTIVCSYRKQNPKSNWHRKPYLLNAKNILNLKIKIRGPKIRTQLILSKKIRTQLISKNKSTKFYNKILLHHQCTPFNSKCTTLYAKETHSKYLHFDIFQNTFQHANKSTTLLGITQYIAIKHKTKDHNYYAIS